ncbi:MAG TPA: hypothetical protein EYH45_01085 [Candidatus Caldiarchaeum subterraneum]|uniref:Uncharacterized protein n=1 Tax=Caldiarchaeum subterraneum TaxID=311458 RepID=A0A832ZUA9_CALS0|nr:hypothetical protein [Candidatus Caldarchaeum subterraneum]
MKGIDNNYDNIRLTYQAMRELSEKLNSAFSSFGLKFTVKNKITPVVVNGRKQVNKLTLSLMCEVNLQEFSHKFMGVNLDVDFNDKTTVDLLKIEFLLDARNIVYSMFKQKVLNDKVLNETLASMLRNSQQSNNKIKLYSPIQ